MDISKDIIIFDTSYVVFYRYYSLVTWYKCHAGVPGAHLKEHGLPPEFLEKYDKTFETLLLDMSKMFNTPTHNIIFAKDCPRDKIWRTKLFPLYKAHRDEKETCFNKDIFKHTFDVLFPALQKKYGFQEMQHRHLEADDCVALFVKYFRRDGHMNNVHIITNDNDYIQLCKYNVNIMNLQHKNICERVEDALTYIEVKKIQGDKSDNIAPIAKKVGEKTALKIAKSKELFDKYMSQPEARQQYELNSILIDFTFIPEALQHEFEHSYKNIKYLSK